jgi:hypothetical protein
MTFQYQWEVFFYTKYQSVRIYKTSLGISLYSDSPIPRSPCLPALLCAPTPERFGAGARSGYAKAQQAGDSSTHPVNN